MSRKAVCSRCGRWFYNHNGQFICLPDTYDDTMCQQCNREIDDGIKDADWKRDFDRLSKRGE